MVQDDVVEKASHDAVTSSRMATALIDFIVAADMRVEMTSTGGT